MFINKLNGVGGYLRPQAQKIKKEKKAILSESAVVFEKDGQNNRKQEKREKPQQENTEENTDNELGKNSDHINIFV